MFEENDYIIYKKKVCKIKLIKENSFNNQSYYVLVPIDDASLTISVPVNNIDDIRPIISIDEVEDIINKIPDISIIKNNDKYIENEYKQLLSTGKHEDLIKIIKTAYCRNEDRKEAGKKISERDVNYFIMAERLLYNEFSIVLNMPFEEVKKYIIDKLNNIMYK